MAPACPRPAKPTVALVTAHWGDGDDEPTAITRLIAGAVVRHATVDVLHLSPRPSHEADKQPRDDSVFRVHTVPLADARPLRSAIVRAALSGTSDEPLHLPEAARSLLEGYEGRAQGLGRLLERLRPDVVVLAGCHQPIEVNALGRRGDPQAPRVVALPFTASPARLDETHLRAVLERADTIAWLHPGERAAFERAGLCRTVPLDLALPLNRGAVTNRLFGVRFFGRYVLLIRQFPPGGARRYRSVTHEVLNQVLGGVSVAEVDGDRWRITDGKGTLQLPVTPTRVNLCRLMAHAEMTIDLRPAGPFGREAVESMLLHTPVVVPEHSAAMAHACAGGGGLWYRDVGELLDAASTLLDSSLRRRLADQGAAYAIAHHGDTEHLVDRVGTLVFGGKP